MLAPLRSAAVVGATGLVGGHILRQLVADSSCEQVVSIGRRSSGIAAPTLKDITAELDRPETYREHLAVDCVFSALGTTIKKAGSEDAFRRVDFEYPLAVARAAVERGTRRYVLVSAVGADAKSSVFYNRVKGDLEDALRALSFPRGVRILHPSILLGDRAESRPLERVAATFMQTTAPLFAVGLAKYRAIRADDVARAAISAARDEGNGVVVYEGASLFEAAKRALS